MGRRGPAPAPRQLRLLRGDAPGRINNREPAARDTIPVPPAGMARDVKDIWDYVIAELIAMKTAASADRDALACYCEAVVVHRKSSAILAQSPVLVKGTNGGMMRNPALQVQRDSAHTIRAFAQEFGLTPSGRTRIQTEGRASGEQNNPFAASG